MVVVDGETEDLLVKLTDVFGEQDQVFQRILDYVFSGRYMEKDPWGRVGGFSDEELKKWLRSLLARRVKALKNIIFLVLCPSCGAAWRQRSRANEERECIECPVCHSKICDPEILKRVPLAEELPYSLDELSEEQKSKMSDDAKEMIAFNEGYRYGEAAGIFQERYKWLERYYIREEKRNAEKMVEVPASEAEIIKKLKEERGFGDEETLVAVPKLSSIKGSEEMVLAVLFSIKDETPLTQHQLAHIMQLTQPRLSQILAIYEGKLVKAIRIENLEGDRKRRSMRGYYMPREVKEKLAETLFPANVIFKHVRPLAEKYPELAWNEGVLS